MGGFVSAWRCLKVLQRDDVFCLCGRFEKSRNERVILEELFCARKIMRAGGVGRDERSSRKCSDSIELR